MSCLWLHSKCLVLFLLKGDEIFCYFFPGSLNQFPLLRSEMFLEMWLHASSEFQALTVMVGKVSITPGLSNLMLSYISCISHISHNCMLLCCHWAEITAELHAKYVFSHIVVFLLKCSKAERLSYLNFTWWEWIFLNSSHWMIFVELKTKTAFMCIWI